jgi:ketosteroid isomerase-like protein
VGPGSAQVQHPVEEQERVGPGSGADFFDCSNNPDIVFSVMMRDYDRVALLFTPDAVVRIPHIHAEATGREEIRAGAERLQGLLDYFVQTTHPGTIVLNGDTASGRAYIQELIGFRDGRSELNYAIYHDRYRRTADGWKFTERTYEVRYLDRSPLAASPPRAEPVPG